jgi:hypothetical protein
MSVKSSSQANASVRPGVERLELRDVPSATHLGVALPAGPLTAGAAATVTVTALDASGNVATDYAGTVQLTSSDAKAVLPGSYTFTAADAGKHTFTVQLQTAGTPSVLATDTAVGTITGSASVSVVPAAVDHFAVQVGAGATAGQAVAVTVVAQDASGNTVPTYAGTAHFASSDAQLTPPADHAFAAADNGSFTTKVVFDTAGNQTLTVTAADGVHGSGAVTVAPGAVTHFDVTGPATASIGNPDPITVVARDGFGNVATNYLGTVGLTLTDQSGAVAGQAATHTFSAADAGTATISVVPMTRGPLTVAVADQANPAAAGQMSVTAGYPTASQNYVATLFQQLLGRPPELADLMHYGSMLDQGDSRESVVREIEATPEYRKLAVSGLYQNVLGRAADPSGLDAFVAAMGRGMTIDGVAEALLSSDEYYNGRGHGTDAGFVTALYQDLLQRAPDDGGLKAWTGWLSQGQSRWQVAQGLLLSSEAERISVSAAYNQFLNRDPDPSGLAAFVMQQQQGRTTADLYAVLLASDEYYQKSQAA